MLHRNIFRISFNTSIQKSHGIYFNEKVDKFFRKYGFAILTLIGSATAMKAQTDSGLTNEKYSTLMYRVFDDTNQNINDAFQLGKEEQYKLWRQSTQTRGYNHQYDIEDTDAGFSIYFADVDMTNIVSVTARFTAYVDGDIINGNPGLADGDPSVDMVLQIKEDTGSNRGRTAYNDVLSSATVHDVKHLTPGNIIGGASVDDDIAHEDLHRKFADAGHNHGKNIPVANVEIFNGTNWIPYPFPSDINIRTIMSTGSGRKIATNSPQYSTAGADGNVYLQMKRNNATPVWDIRVPKTALTNGGLETLDEVANRLDNVLNFRVYELDVPAADKIRNKTPEINVAGNVVNISNAGIFNVENQGVPNDLMWFVGNKNTPNILDGFTGVNGAHDGKQLQLPGAADKVGHKMNESVDIMAVYGIPASDAVIWVADFNQDQLSQTVLAENTDNPPVANCQNATVQLDAAGNATIDALNINNNSTDDNGIVSYTVLPSSVDCSDIGNITVTLTVTDTAGQTDTCTATVTVEDNINPTVIGQPATGNLNGTGTVTIPVASVDGGSFDNCDVSLTLTPNTYTAIGTYTAVLEGTDSSNNTSSVNVTITIIDTVDNTPPNAVCQNLTVSLDVNGNATIQGSDIDGGSTDNVAIAMLIPTPNSFTCSDIGTNTVTLTVTDTSGNTDTCTTTVTVVDDLAPINNTQTITLDLADGSPQTITWNDLDNGTTDNCTIASGTVNPDSFNTIGTYDVDFTTVDSEGNETTTVQEITVENTLGVADQEIMGLVMYPNPADNVLHIEANETLTNIKLYNLLGQELINETINATQIQLSLEKLSSGMYLIEISDKEGSKAVKRLIKK